MPALIPIAVGVSVAATAYGAYEQKKSSDRAAQVDTATADYNARADLAASHQLDLNTIQNVKTARAEGDIYLSRQAASYASGGILATSGSPLHAQIMNAGKLQQQIQQQWIDSQQKQQQYGAAAQVGRLEGAARAKADRASGTLALINGGAKMASMAFQSYESGVFNGSDGATVTAGPLR